MRRHPTAPVNVARISVATSGTDFTAPEADFAALIRAAGFCPGRSHLSRESCRSWDGVWSARSAYATTDMIREFAWRPVRSALRRQCGSPVRTMTFPFVITGRPVTRNYRNFLHRAVRQLIRKLYKAYQLTGMFHNARWANFYPVLAVFNEPPLDFFARPRMTSFHFSPWNRTSCMSLRGARCPLPVWSGSVARFGPIQLGIHHQPQRPYRWRSSTLACREIPLRRRHPRVAPSA